MSLLHRTIRLSNGELIRMSRLHLDFFGEEWRRCGVPHRLYVHLPRGSLVVALSPGSRGLRQPPRRALDRLDRGDRGGGVTRRGAAPCYPLAMERRALTDDELLALIEEFRRTWGPSPDDPREEAFADALGEFLNRCYVGKVRQYADGLAATGVAVRDSGRLDAVAKADAIDVVVRNLRAITGLVERV